MPFIYNQHTCQIIDIPKINAQFIFCISTPTTTTTKTTPPSTIKTPEWWQYLNFFSLKNSQAKYKHIFKVLNSKRHWIIFLENHPAFKGLMKMLPWQHTHLHLQQFLDDHNTLGNNHLCKTNNKNSSSTQSKKQAHLNPLPARVD